jgi:hypothetical protein
MRALDISHASNFDADGNVADCLSQPFVGMLVAEYGFCCITAPPPFPAADYLQHSQSLSNVLASLVVFLRGMQPGSTPLSCKLLRMRYQISLMTTSLAIFSRVEEVHIVSRASVNRCDATNVPTRYKSSHRLLYVAAGEVAADATCTHAADVPL